MSGPRGLSANANIKGARIAIVGGGIAGCSAAYALHRKGFKVTLFEKEETLAAGTSGNPLALFEPRFERSKNPNSTFFLSAYLHSLALYEKLEQECGGIWHGPRGCFNFAGNREEAEKMQAIAAMFPDLSKHLIFKDNGLFFPTAGCLNTARICQALTKGVEVKLGQKIKGDPGFDAIVMANGHRSFDGWGQNPFRLTRGQINYLPGTGTKFLHAISFPGGYLTPETADGFHILGTSFEIIKDPEGPGWETLSQENLDANLAALELWNSELAKAWQGAPLKGRVGLRAETLDHMPFAGPAFEAEKVKVIFREKQKLHHTQRTVGNEADIKGLYVLSGFASRGFTAAPYAAEILASQMAGTPPPCPAPITKALDPKRFLVKGLLAGKIKAT